MKKPISLAALCLLVVGPALAADTGAVAHLDDPVFGFSVDIPAIGDPAGAPLVQRLIVMGPAVDGFAPNCNLQIQYTDMGLDAYLELTRKQFAAHSIELVAETRRVTSGLPGSIIEYTASTAGRKLHHLALAVASSDRVWLLTCTSLEESFPRHRPAFLQIVDSFRVKKDASPARE